ncbi:cupin domain-containing protein [Amycolatopsis methanolica]|uniref:cupin domain-containing protein n=1 Tax=Amycolatopsis methanolica TaxID=1814 RepID=UPI003447AE7B
MQFLGERKEELDVPPLHIQNTQVFDRARFSRWSPRSGRREWRHEPDPRHRSRSPRRRPGQPITLLTDTDTLTSNRAAFEPGATGAPPHFHTNAAEVFFVLSGRLDVLLDEEVVTLGEGDFLTVPPRVPHALTFTPGMDRFDYYRLLDRVNRGEADPREIRESQER